MIKIYLQWLTNRKCIWFIERRQFQWPWTTPNPDFKVMLFFDAEYIINGWRYGHSYYGRWIKQQLSYRKQIVRQLRTQYAERMYDNPVTLKSRLTVTQGHWKRNHWVDHTRLTISQVIGYWILSWHWNVGQRTLKVIEISANRKLGCGFLFAFYSNYGCICSRLWD